jgi:hypothetical protein
MWVGDLNHWNRYTFLLRKVIKHSIFYLTRPDLWDIYDLETKEQHANDRVHRV